MRLTAALSVLALGLAAAPPGVLAEASPSRVVRDVHARGRYPSDLSVLPQEPASSAGGSGASQGGTAPQGPRIPVRLYRSGGGDTPPPPPESLELPRFGAFGEMLGWVLVGLSGLLLIGALVYGLSRLRFQRNAEDAETPKHTAKPSSPELDPLLAMPELGASELARLGRFKEAIHALLIEGLLATGFKPEGRARGTTAREVVRALDGADPRKPPLGSLLGETELVWFGGREATQEAYERALGFHAGVVGGARR